MGAFRNNFLLPNKTLLELCVNDKYDLEELNEKCLITKYNISNNILKIGGISIDKKIVFPINKIRLNNLLVNCPINIYKFLLKTGFSIDNCSSI